MKKHTKIYMDALGYKVGDHMPCEFSGMPIQAVHHISPRRMGGNPTGKKDCIENLMGMTQHYHDRCENRIKGRAISTEDQVEVHFSFLRRKGIEFNENYFNELNQNQ